LRHDTRPGTIPDTFGFHDWTLLFSSPVSRASRCVQSSGRRAFVFSDVTFSDYRAMKDEDIQLLAARCRALASNADGATKKRLLDLALRYEAMQKTPDGASDAPKIVSLAVQIMSQPTTIQSITVQRGRPAEHPHGDGGPGKASGEVVTSPASDDLRH
jgi:hypothetical protein